MGQFYNRAFKKNLSPFPKMNVGINYLVSVVVLNWNGWSDTLECLESLSRLSHLNTKIIVVDNGSEDDSIEKLESSKFDFSLIKSKINLGFSGGNNLGILAAIELGADYILLLNNDTVVDPNIISEFLSAALRNPNAQAFGAKIYYYSEPNRIWYAGANPSDSKYDCPGHRGSDEVDFNSYDEIESTNFINGCAFFISAKVINEIGLLDEDYFYMFEDVDWSEKLVAAGHECLYVPRAKLWHKTHRSTNGALTAHWSYFYERNRLLWLQRFYPEISLIEILSYQLGLIIKKIGFPVKFRPPFIVRNYLTRNLFPAFGMLVGVIDYLRGYRGSCPNFIRFLGRR